MGYIINVPEITLKYKEKIFDLISIRKEEGKKPPKAANIIVGEDGGSIYYLDNIEKLYSKLGIEYESFKFEKGSKEEDVIEKIKELNQDDYINGIMLFMPLPKDMDSKKVSSHISYKKDIDGLTPINIGKLYSGDKCFIPNTPKAIVTILKDTGIKLEGKKVVILGRSNIVGKPTFELFLRENATVTVCHSKTENLKEVTKEADILISAIGKPLFVDDSFIKEGAVVIDVGTSSVQGKIVGDVKLSSVIGKASFVTSVPGGVGSLTTTMLAMNLCEALKYND